MTQTAYTVTTPRGETKLMVMDRDEGFPSTFALLATTAPDKVVIRISGGCKGMSPEDKLVMLDYFAEGMPGFQGMIWSGSTRQFTKDGKTDPMVTDVPGVIAAAYPGCVALGSAPRTDILRLVGESRLVLDSYGTGPNPSMSGILIVQNRADGKMLNAAGEADWGGDLNAAFEMMDNLVNCAGFRRAGVIAWNGGPVTKDEIMRSAKRGWPTIVIRGSGRVADEIAAQLDANDPVLMNQLPKNHNLVAADRNDSATLRIALQGFGFLSQAS